MECDTPENDCDSLPLSTSAANTTDATKANFETDTFRRSDFSFRTLYGMPPLIRGKKADITDLIAQKLDLSLASNEHNLTGTNETKLLDDNLEDLYIKKNIFGIGRKIEYYVTPVESMYSCAACLEVFYLLSGAEAHLKRKSTKIYLDCPHCHLSVAFDNRCLLIHHFLAHDVIPTVASLKGRVAFGPISAHRRHDYRLRGLCENLPSSTATVSSGENVSTPTAEQEFGSSSLAEQTDDSVSIIDESSDLHMQESHPAQQPISGNVSSENLSPPSSISREINWHCFICDKDFKRSRSFYQHLKGKQSDLSKNLIRCGMDEVLSYTECGHSYHLHLFHSKTTVGPFVCPECGKYFQQWKSMNEHARNKCFHFKKSYRYQCSLDGPCNYSCFSFSDFIEHLGADHVQHIIQCNECCKEFNSNAAFSIHYDEHHGTHGRKDESCILNAEQIGGLTRNLIQCAVCEILFHTTQDYQDHVLLNANTHCQMVIVFPCDYCFFASKSGPDLYKHCQKLHLKEFRKRSSSAPLQTQNQNENLDTKCQDIKAEILMVKTALDCEPRQHANEKLVAATVSTRKPFTCIVCNKKGFQTYPGLRKHVILQHKGEKLMEYLADLKRTRATAIESKKLLPALKSEVGSVQASRSEDGIAKLASAGSDASTPLSTFCLASDLRVRSKARFPDGSFRCLKCSGTVLPSEEEFFLHFRRFHMHQIDSSSSEEEFEEDNEDETWPSNFYKLDPDIFWCPECEVEFVTLASLLKHIQCSHEFIEDPKKYLENVGYGPRPVKPLKENQCGICRLRCASTSDFEQHIRSHGLAFLQLRQEQKVR